MSDSALPGVFTTDMAREVSPEPENRESQLENGFSDPAAGGQSRASVRCLRLFVPSPGQPADSHTPLLASARGPRVPERLRLPVQKSHASK